MTIIEIIFLVTSFREITIFYSRKGITQISDIKAIDGNRKRAILIRSSPHKIGSEDILGKMYLMLIMVIYDIMEIIK